MEFVILRCVVTQGAKMSDQRKQQNQQRGGGQKPGKQQQQQPKKKPGPGEQQAEHDKKWRETEDPSLLPDTEQGGR
jgi:hypothetical protein